MECVRIRADFIIVSPTEILHPGQIVVREGRILAVEDENTARPDLDLTGHVLLPGLINAHTHLEFSDCRTPFPPGSSFPDWIRRVVAYRRNAQQNLNEHQSLRFRRAALLTGIVESISYGVHAIGDIVSAPWQPSDLPSGSKIEMELKSDHQSDSNPTLLSNSQVSHAQLSRHILPLHFSQVTAFGEIIGLTAERCQHTAAWSAALARQATPQCDVLAACGVSPHAPYSVLMPLVQKVFETLPVTVPIAMHVAESLEELEFLGTGRGAFRDSFEALGLPVPTSLPGIDDCIQMLARQTHALLVHGNYLTPSQISLAAQSQSIACVYCPRTHQHFAHSAYPLEKMLESGLPVVLGTDSRASNPDLNLWSEVVTARNKHPGLSPEQALAAVTTTPAQSLGVANLYGTLTVGKAAAINVLPRHPGWHRHNLLEAMTGSWLSCRPLRFAFG